MNPEPPKPKELAAVYGRVSTGEQQNSIDAQDIRITKYASFKELEIRPDLTFFDSDVSGRTPLIERPQGALLWEALNDRGVKHLLVVKLSRLGRRFTDVVNVLENFFEFGVTLHVIDFGGDSMSTAGAAGKMMLRMLAVFDEFDRENIVDQIQKVMDHKFSIGEQISYPPYGWKAIATGRFNKHGRSINRLEECPVEQAIIREIVAARAAGQRLEDICNDLNRRCIPTKRHGTVRRDKKGGGANDRIVLGRWSKGNLSRLLHNRHVSRLLAATSL